MRIHRLVIGASAFLVLGGLLFQAHGQSGSATGQAPAGGKAAEVRAAGDTSSTALAAGKKIFVERCAKCHGEDGTKPLEGGPALSERKLTDEQLGKMVRGRLKDAPEEQQRAVTEYIRSLQKK